MSLPQTTPIDTNDIPIAVKIDLLRAEIGMWKNSRFQQQMRHRVFKQLGNQDQLMVIEKELIGIETALDLLRQEWHALTDEPSP